MTIVNMHEAKTRLSQLVEAALRGEEVLIARAGKPVVRIEPLVAERTGLRGELGGLGGKLDRAEAERIVAAIDEPWTDEDIEPAEDESLRVREHS